MKTSLIALIMFFSSISFAGVRYPNPLPLFLGHQFTVGEADLFNSKRTTLEVIVDKSISQCNFMDDFFIFAKQCGLQNIKVSRTIFSRKYYISFEKEIYTNNENTGCFVSIIAHHDKTFECYY